MNKKNFRSIILLGCVIAISLSIQSCKQQVIETYSENRALFFERSIKAADGIGNIRIDTISVSFSHYIGAETIKLPFTIRLIGDLLQTDKEYKVVPVPELTTAKSGQYTIPTPALFRKGMSTDTLYVTLHKDKVATDEEVFVTLRLTENENFGLGYMTYDDIKIRFNNKIVKPLWWDDDYVTAALFGNYSFKKLETIVAANPNFKTIVGLSQTDQRIIALETKKYIKEHGITEDEEGLIPMDIPMY